MLAKNDRRCYSDRSSLQLLQLISQLADPIVASNQAGEFAGSQLLSGPTVMLHKVLRSIHATRCGESGTLGRLRVDPCPAPARRAAKVASMAAFRVSKAASTTALRSSKRFLISSSLICASDDVFLPLRNCPA
mmetsp:Transcript_85799/g.171354  ORF Transcript_85799/g.171354 Transcript_85799/m.171354 type:complete len:133 (+) Transcript_85799:104-502(+)